MAVITISREYGSAGSEIARAVADELGYHLVDKAVIGRILAGYGLIDFDKVYESESGLWSNFDTRLRTIVSMMDRLALAVARHGHSVVLGRGIFVVLSGKAGTLNVRLRAPFDWRVARIMDEKGASDHAKAEAEVREGDKVRSSFVSSVYGVRWDSMDRFDLALDTSKIGVEMASSWIAEAAKALPAADPRSGLGKEDPVLDEAVASELGCTGRT